MKTATKQILTFVHVLTWIVFVGLCIKAGAILTSYLVSVFVNAAGASDLYMGLSFEPLFKYDKWYYSAMVSIVIALLCLKAYAFYLLIKVFGKLNIVHPFSTEIGSLITNISHVTLTAGILALVAESTSKWLLKKGVSVAYDWGSSEMLFMAGIVFTIALIFQRGVEIQSENELTI